MLLEQEQDFDARAYLLSLPFDIRKARGGDNEIKWTDQETDSRLVASFFRPDRPWLSLYYTEKTDEHKRHDLGVALFKQAVKDLDTDLDIDWAVVSRETLILGRSGFHDSMTEDELGHVVEVLHTLEREHVLTVMGDRGGSICIQWRLPQHEALDFNAREFFVQTSGPTGLHCRSHDQTRQPQSLT